MSIPKGKGLMVNNFVLRMISAVILAPLVIYVVYLGGIYFQTLALICLFLMLHEWFAINKQNKRILFITIGIIICLFMLLKLNLIDIAIYNVGYIMYAMLLFLIYGIFQLINCEKLNKVITCTLLVLITYIIIHAIVVPKPYGFPLMELLYFCGSIMVAVILGHLMKKSKQEITFFATGLLYITIPMLYLIFKSFEESENFFKIAIWILGVVWGCDIFAYLGGRLIGGAKLAPQISPNKTWSGAIVGAIATMMLSYFGISRFFQMDRYHILSITTVMVIAAILGDLLESKAKRILDVKDSGNIIPGHGGILDRLDSLLMVLYIFVIAEMFCYLKLDLKMLLTSAKWV